MLRNWRSKPYKPFLMAGVLSMAVAGVYYFFFRESLSDIVIGSYFFVTTYQTWFLLGLYALTLGGIYYAAFRNNLKTRRWIISTHYIFLVLFIILFLASGSFGTGEFEKGRRFLTVVVAYLSLYLIDIFVLLTGLILILVNVLSVKRK